MLPNIFTNLPSLETEKLILRKLLYSDKKDIFEYAKKSEVAKDVLWYPHQTEMDTLEFLNTIYEEYRKNRPAPWGILLKENNKIIGTAGFVNCDEINHKAEIGYVLSKVYWGKGIMSEAVKEIIKFGFESLELNRIEARCNTSNIASGKLLEKIGFTYEGVLREQLVVKGKFKDMKIYSLLSKDVY